MRKAVKKLYITSSTVGELHLPCYGFRALVEDQCRALTQRDFSCESKGDEDTCSLLSIVVRTGMGLDAAVWGRYT